MKKNVISAKKFRAAWKKYSTKKLKHRSYKNSPDSSKVHLTLSKWSVVLSFFMLYFSCTFEHFYAIYTIAKQRHKVPQLVFSGMTKEPTRGAISHHLRNAQGIWGLGPLTRREFCYLERVHLH